MHEVEGRGGCGCGCGCGALGGYMTVAEIVMGVSKRPST